MTKSSSKSKISRIKLCGVQGCCPVVEIHHGNPKKVVITDDYGGKVTLTEEQLLELQKMPLKA